MEYLAELECDECGRTDVRDGSMTLQPTPYQWARVITSSGVHKTVCPACKIAYKARRTLDVTRFIQESMERRG